MREPRPVCPPRPLLAASGRVGRGTGPTLKQAPQGVLAIQMGTPGFASKPGNRPTTPPAWWRADSRNLTKTWSAPAQDPARHRVASMAPSGWRCGGGQRRPRRFTAPKEVNHRHRFPTRLSTRHQQPSGRTVSPAITRFKLEWFRAGIAIIGSGLQSAGIRRTSTRLGCEVTMIRGPRSVMPPFDPRTIARSRPGG